MSTEEVDKLSNVSPETRRHLRVVVLMLLAILVVSVVCSKEVPDKQAQVTSAFYNTVNTRTLQERQEFLLWWGTGMPFWSVKQTDNTNVYEVKVVVDPYDRTRDERWAINMRSKEIWPLDGAALLSAILFFCKDRQDGAPHCISYFKALDQLKERLPSR